MKKFIPASMITVLMFIIVITVIFVKQTGQRKTTLIPVTITLKWLHQAQFAGLYVADKKGYYNEAGLDVTLKPFDYKNQPIDEVSTGRAQFGVAGADEIIIARSQGKKVKALAVIYQQTPVVAYTLKKNNINTLAHFKGKKLGMENSENVQSIVKSMLAVNGIDYEKDLLLVPISFDAKQLLNGEVDIATGYSINEPIQAQYAGEEVVIFSPENFDISSYADVLFTSEEMITTKPELVRSFTRATLKGWEYALANIDEAVNYTLEYKDQNSTNMIFNLQKTELENSRKLIKPGPNFRIGTMNYTGWRNTYDLLKKYRILNNEIDIFESYTSDFIKTIE